MTLNEALDAYTHAVTLHAGSNRVDRAFADLQTAHRLHAALLHVQEATTYLARETRAYSKGGHLPPQTTEEPMTLADDLGRYALNAGLRFLGSDARSIAEDLEREKIIIDREDAKIPEVAPRVALELLTDAGYTADSHVGGPLEHVSDAVDALDAWAIKAEAVRRDEEAELTKRRNELAVEYWAEDNITRYADLGDGARRLVDTYIAAQDQLERGQA